MFGEDFMIIKFPESITHEDYEKIREFFVQEFEEDVEFYQMELEGLTGISK